LINLPSGCELKDITKIIWGGKVKSIELLSHKDKAIIKFLLPESATTYMQNYSEKYSNGIPWPSKRVELPTGMDLTINASNVTRCVRINRLKDHHTQGVLRRAAMEDKRDLEDVLIGRDATTRVSLTP
jgi:hypothetical protein